MPTSMRLIDLMRESIWAWFTLAGVTAAWSMGGSILGVHVAGDMPEPEGERDDGEREQDTSDYQGDHGSALALEGSLDGGR